MQVHIFFATIGGDEMSVRISREHLAVAMIRANLNVNRLSEKSGVSRATVTAIKTGKSCSKETAEKLVAILGSDIIEKEV